MNFKRNAIGFVSAASIALLAGAAVGQDKGNPSGLMLASASSGNGITAGELPQGGMLPTDAQLTLETPQGNVQTFGAAGDADNCLVTVSLPEGLEVIGSSWDVRIETIGASWLSEVQFQYRTSDPNDPQINLTPATGQDEAGVADISSGGVVLFADAMIDNIPVGADGEFRIEIVDTFDDAAGAADADLFNLPVGGDFGLTLACDDQAACDAAMADPDAITSAGSCEGWEFAAAGGPPVDPEPVVAVPVNNIWALALLIALLAGLGVVAVRRFA